MIYHRRPERSIRTGLSASVWAQRWSRHLPTLDLIKMPGGVTRVPPEHSGGSDAAAHRRQSKAARRTEAVMGGQVVATSVVLRRLKVRAAAEGSGHAVQRARAHLSPQHHRCGVCAQFSHLLQRYRKACWSATSALYCVGCKRVENLCRRPLVRRCRRRACAMCNNRCS